MSHEATAWARKQRGLKPTARIVLWELCDRYHPDNGCFPSQETLARDCELSRSALNDNLNALEEAGLIRREQRRDEKTYRQRSTLYRLAFEAGFEAKPCPESGHGNEGEAVSENDAEPCPENGESRVRISDTNPVREPVKEPVREREGASANEEDRSAKPGTADFTKRVQKFVTGDGFSEGEWPRWSKGVTLDWIARQFAALTEAERRQAEENRDAFLAKCRRDGIPASGVMGAGNYFKGRVWETLTERDRAMAADTAARRAGKPDAAKPANFAPAFGPVHSLMLWRILGRGPDRPDIAVSGHWFANEMRSAWPTLANFWQQTDLKGGVVADEEAIALAGAMEFSMKDSGRLSVWRVWLREKGLPELRIGERGTYVPRGGPAAIEQFWEAIQGKEAGQ